jgi:hypothetical protein
MSFGALSGDLGAPVLTVDQVEAIARRVLADASKG